MSPSMLGGGPPTCWGNVPLASDQEKKGLSLLLLLQLHVRAGLGPALPSARSHARSAPPAELLTGPLEFQAHFAEWGGDGRNCMSVMQIATHFLLVLEARISPFSSKICSP